jgi:hypothetical protein
MKEMRNNPVIIFAVIMMFLGMGAGIWITISGNIYGIGLSFISVIMIGSWLLVASGYDKEDGND